MSKIITFPVPHDAIIKNECPKKHRKNFEWYSVQHEGGSCFITLRCPTCGWSTAGLFVTGFLTQDIEIEDGE